MTQTVQLLVRVRDKRNKPNVYYLRVRKTTLDAMGWTKKEHNKQLLRLHVSPTLTIEGKLSFDSGGVSGWLACRDYERLTEQLRSAGYTEGDSLSADLVAAETQTAPPPAP